MRRGHETEVCCEIYEADVARTRGREAEIFFFALSARKFQLLLLEGLLDEDLHRVATVDAEGGPRAGVVDPAHFDHVEIVILSQVRDRLDDRPVAPQARRPGHAMHDTQADARYAHA